MADIADLPSISRSGRLMNVWTGDQLLDAIVDHELYPQDLLAPTTGMRRGELAGLGWRNVDLDASRLNLNLNRQTMSVEYKLIEDHLKTASSRRTIDLDEQTVAMLRRHRRHQLQERMATGQRGDDGFVFARPDGSPVHPDLINQTFQRFMAQIDLPTIRLRDLRRNHASILLRENVHPRVVSERLGQSSIAFTMTVHQHLMPGMQAEDAATVGAAVFGD